jgi:hypothetical protein
MTNDEMQVLRDFRAEIPRPDEETRRRVYAYATGGMKRFTGRRLGIWSHRSLPSKSPRLVAVLAGAAICTATAALAATGTFSGGGTRDVQAARHTRGSTQTVGHSGPADAPYDALSVALTRSGGTLRSLAVTVNPNIDNATVQVEVLHGAASTTPGVATGTIDVVYQNQVSTTAPSTASPGALSTWSGTLSPSDWKGGCQSGLYEILAVSVGPGTSLADANYKNSESDYSGWFSCGG